MSRLIEFLKDLRLFGAMVVVGILALVAKGFMGP